LVDAPKWIKTATAARNQPDVLQGQAT